METFKLFVDCCKHTIDSTPFFIFALMVASDIITGFLKGFIKKKPSSCTGLKGIAKHVGAIFGVLVIATTFEMLGQVEYANLLLMAMYAVYGISLIGNLNACGVKLPAWLLEHFGDVKDRTPKGDE